jgi:hypothetical protein
MAPHEKHYSCAELGEKWHLSSVTIRRLCEEHGGILIIDRPETMHKRRYRSIRVPQSTADEIYRQHFITRVRRSDPESIAVAPPTIPRPAPVPPTRPIYSAPEVTIFTHHFRDCQYMGFDEYRNCNCPKSFRFMDHGGMITRRSGTRSWAEAEEMKRTAIALMARGKYSMMTFAIAVARDQLVLNVNQAAVRLGMTKDALQKIIDERKLPAELFGKNVYITHTNLQLIGVNKAMVQ